MQAKATLRKGTSTVYIRVQEAATKVDFKVSTGLFIDPIHWDKNVPGYSAKSNVPKEVKKEFNRQLDELLKLVNENIQEGFTKEWLAQLINEYFDPETKQEDEPTEVWGSSFFDRAEQYLIEGKGKKLHKEAIIAVFRRLRRYEAWQREIMGNKSFELKTETFGREQLLDFMKYIENEYTYYVKYTDFYSKFEIYRQTMRPSSKNSACSGGSRLKAFLNWCVKKGYTNDLTFQDVNTHRHVYGDAYYLLPEERDRLIDATYGCSFHAPLVRDMFLFQCFVGCRIGDLFTIQRTQINNGWLEYIPGKNLKNNKTELVRIPLHPVAQRILERYAEYSPRLFPVISEPQYNEYIKMILDFAGIHRRVTILNPLTRKEEQRPICDVATSHTARKTFIANLYNKVRDQALVASLTGHAPNSKAFERYRTIDDTIKNELINNLK